MDKYGYLLDSQYSKRGKVYVYLDDAGIAFSPSWVLPSFYISVLKFYAWVIINKLNPCKFEVVTDIEQLNNDDILLTFFFENFTTLSGKLDASREILLEKLKNSKAFKVVNLSHYGYNTGLGSRNAQKAKIDLFVSENNLARNSRFFQYYYQWYKRDVYALPFVPQKRFQNTVKFQNRKNKAVATGTITFPMADSDFIRYFKDDKLQPMRHEIFNNAKKLEEYIDCCISPIRGNEPSAKSSAEDMSARHGKLSRGNLTKYIKVLKRIASILMLPPRIAMLYLGSNQSIKIRGAQKQYYNTDIVQKYNEYRMFVCPEEIIDLPGIGFVEGMACGSAYLGIRDPMYSDLGLVDKIHYIGYDGTIGDLQEKIGYYQNHPAELEAIAERGYRFILENLNAEVVCEKFYAHLEDLCVARQKAEIPANVAKDILQDPPVNA